MLKPFMFDETPSLVAELVRSMDNGELAHVSTLIDFSGWLVRLGLPEDDRRAAIAAARAEIGRAVYTPDLWVILVYLRGDSLELTATSDLEVVRLFMDCEPNLFTAAPLVTREWWRDYGRAVFSTLETADA